MKKTKLIIMCLIFMNLSFQLPSIVTAEAINSTPNREYNILKKGMENSSVKALQEDLKEFGYFSVEPTGFYGDITVAAVKEIQKEYNLQLDGIAGPMTFSVIDALKKSSANATQRIQVSRGTSSGLLPWFGVVETLFAKGQTVTVYDIDTGLSFKAKRSYGYNHADCEPLTKVDTAIMKKIYGGQWSWDRRAVVVTISGRKIAASMAGMPHAGVDKLQPDIFVKNRSAGYGTGANLDAVKANGMDGHFDIHFLGSKTHGTNRVDENHQAMIEKAAKWIKELS